MDFINNYAVDVFSLSGKFIGNWPSSSLAAKELGIKTKGNISSCLNGRRNNAGGYIWKYSSQQVTILPGEEWKPVVNFENLYAVSNKGRIASLQYHGKKSFSIMSQSICKGYKIVKIRNSKTGFQGSLKVHRLVALAFIPNPENKPAIDHIDADKCNNSVENLRWVTNLENQRNPLTLPKISDNIKRLNSKKVGPSIAAANRSIKVKHFDGNDYTVYNCASDAGKKTGHTTSTILEWCRNDRYGWSLV